MVYRACPKCHHQPLPTEQALPAQCPACGLVLAKYQARGAGRVERGAASRIVGAALTAGEQTPSPGEPRVSSLVWHARLALLLAFALWTCFI
jgi:hypothetical protein